MTDKEKANYERSYKSMWEDIRRARAERDQLQKLADAGCNLARALRHDMGSGLRGSETLHEMLGQAEAAYR